MVYKIGKYFSTIRKAPSESSAEPFSYPIDYTITLSDIIGRKYDYELVRISVYS